MQRQRFRTRHYAETVYYFESKENPAERAQLVRFSESSNEREIVFAAAPPAGAFRTTTADLRRVTLVTEIARGA